jgi:DMSO reductase anchor subunit
MDTQRVKKEQKQIGFVKLAAFFLSTIGFIAATFHYIGHGFLKGACKQLGLATSNLS